MVLSDVRFATLFCSGVAGYLAPLPIVYGALLVIMYSELIRYGFGRRLTDRLDLSNVRDPSWAGFGDPSKDPALRIALGLVRDKKFAALCQRSTGRTRTLAEQGR